MDFNSPLFDRIRIRPTCEEARPSDEPTCERPGCRAPGLYRAPKGRGQEGRYWRFCIDHVRQYNASYNYFDGMTDDAVAAFQKDAVVGHRPTWTMGVNTSGKPKDGPAAPQRDWDYSDPLGVLRETGATAKRRTVPEEPLKPRYSAPVRKALDTLGLEEGVDAAAIKTQYKTLVKRFHPDANGGDRSFEDRLRDIIKAHDVLKTAGLC